MSFSDGHMMHPAYTALPFTLWGFGLRRRKLPWRLGCGTEKGRSGPATCLQSATGRKAIIIEVL